MLPLRVLWGGHVCSNWMQQHIVYWGPERFWKTSVSECSLVQPDSKCLWPWELTHGQVNVELLECFINRRYQCFPSGPAERWAKVHVPSAALESSFLTEVWIFQQLALVPWCNSEGTALALLTIQGNWAQGTSMGKQDQPPDLREIWATKTVSLFGMKLGLLFKIFAHP